MDLDTTLASLRREADALAELRLRCAELRDARERPRTELEALMAAIDDRIDACVRIRELVVDGVPCEQRSSAATALERQFRRLGVLRAHVLSLYLTRTNGDREL
jgi:hypothetical protein